MSSLIAIGLVALLVVIVEQLADYDQDDLSQDAVYANNQRP
jgi:hypothetical protein